jgi:tetraacyldisaccharide-1-P 4'-kinase
MRSSGATVLITTEKDGVKLKGVMQEYAAHTLLARLELTVSNPERLMEMLTTLVQHHDS